MPQKRMECFRLLFDHLAWIKHKRFKEGRKSVKDDGRCWRSKEVNTPQLIGQRVRVGVRVTMLYFDLRLGQTCHSKVMHRKEVTYSNGQLSKEIAWVDLADEMGQGKAHDTLIDWCTGREWPLNCMTVISAWWRSNMPFQRLSGRLSGRWTII